MSMTATDYINQQAVASYVIEAIWPGNKMLPKSWSRWRDDKRSLYQMILKNVALPPLKDKIFNWQNILYRVLDMSTRYNILYHTIQYIVFNKNFNILFKTI